MGKSLLIILCVSFVGASYARSPFVVQLPNDLDTIAKDHAVHSNEEKNMEIATNEIPNNYVKPIGSDLQELSYRAKVSNGDNNSQIQGQANSASEENIQSLVKTQQEQRQVSTESSEEDKTKNSIDLVSTPTTETKDADSLEGFQSDQGAVDNRPLKKSSFIDQTRPPSTTWEYIKEFLYGV